MIAFYIMGLSMKNSRNALFVDLTDSIIEKAVMMMRTTTETEEKVGLKGVLVLSYHSSFEALVCKQQGVRIVTMAQREA
jgi:GTP-dependent phosphoenolpyruvate carboxykinase